MRAERSAPLSRAASSGFFICLWFLWACIPVSACSASPVSTPLRPAPGHADTGAGADAGTLTICTQNLWNYGSPESVRALRRRNVSLAKVAEDLARQEPALVARMSRCDVVAVQELVGETDTDAGAALTQLAQRLGAAEGHPYTARTADTHDVIRNGFLIRTDGPFRVIAFNGSHSADRLPARPSFPRGRWDRGPAELVVELRPAAPRAGAGANGVGGGGSIGGARGSGGVSSSRGGGGIASARGHTSPPRAKGSTVVKNSERLRVRIINAHLKSKIENERSVDPDHERWERLRVLQARALFELARLRLSQNPAEVALVVGDLNGTPGSPARAVLGGGLDPGALIVPRDCIGGQGELTCDLPSQPSLLLDLAAQDPDLRGRGSYRFEGRDELIDAIFAAPAAAILAADPAAGDPGDYDVAIEGRFGQGSDHRLLRVTLHF